ncbi:arsenic resistance protein [Bartonella sp. HY038]|uniref:arsenic resistance protein n=1 Tax=Bartonella sp. HY038 TaxID=2759660 RepID=UPI0015FD35B8|nr:arsenic resistance protein [Bartonella sp. HY038]
MQKFLKLQTQLEHWQAWIYFASVLVALLIVWGNPNSQKFTPFLENLINPALALMLFVTFLQVPLAALGGVFKDLRFLSVLLFGNFIVIPCLVFGLSQIFPLDFLMKLGVLMVLLSPCIDYVVTFTHMGKGDARALLGATALLLLLQMMFLPLYLSLFLSKEAANYIQITPFIDAFLWLIIMPLCLAILVQIWAKRQKFGFRLKQYFDCLPVPATAMVLFIVILAIAPQLGLAGKALLTVLPIYISFAILAPILGLILGKICKLNKPQKRSIAFSMATRNSLVIMPLALTIPNAVPLLPAIIVTQTLIELICQLIYVEISKRL